jgi:hypothetical protein
MLTLAVAGCSVRGRQRDKGDPGQNGARGPRAPAVLRDYLARRRVTATQFRVVVSSCRRIVGGERVAEAHNVVRQTEVTVSATYSSKISSVNDAPKTIGDSGATCDTQSDQTEIPEAVILCANR